MLTTTIAGWVLAVGLGAATGENVAAYAGNWAGVIHVGGWKVSQAEVSQVLESHPAVAESAVTAIRDPQRKKRVVAAVTLLDSAEEGDLLEFCRARLADYKVPRRVHILKELPRTATGKVVLAAEHLPA